MNKKVIQVPIEDDLLGAIDEASRHEKRSRADLIRQACRDYLTRKRDELLDRRYEQGYKRVPEETAIGESQLALLGQVLSDETW